MHSVEPLSSLWTEEFRVKLQGRNESPPPITRFGHQTFASFPRMWKVLSAMGREEASDTQIEIEGILWPHWSCSCLNVSCCCQFDQRNSGMKKYSATRRQRSRVLWSLMSLLPFSCRFVRSVLVLANSHSNKSFHQGLVPFECSGISFSLLTLKSCTVFRFIPAFELSLRAEVDIVVCLALLFKVLAVTVESSVAVLSTAVELIAQHQAFCWGSWKRCAVLEQPKLSGFLSSGINHLWVGVTFPCVFSFPGTFEKHESTHAWMCADGDAFFIQVLSKQQVAMANSAGVMCSFDTAWDTKSVGLGGNYTSALPIHSASLRTR